MKTKLKNSLRELLFKAAASIDPSFAEDPTFSSDPQLAVVRRRSFFGKWQFIALSFSPVANRFFIEVAFSTAGSFPVNQIPVGPDSPAVNGILRFRASELWKRPNRSGGWLIQNPTDAPARDTIALPEGVFETPEAAMEDVKLRVVKWILPYFERSERTQFT